jgi:hypothetical protein
MSILRDPRVIGTAVLLAIFVWGLFGGSFDSLFPKTRIAYLCGDDVCRIDADGANLRLMTENLSAAHLDLSTFDYPSLNNKNHVVYECADVHICIQSDSNASSIKNITLGIDEISSLSYTPALNDENVIAFVCFTDRSFEICKINTNGNEFEVITENDIVDDSPDINNLGQIAFVCYSDEAEEIFRGIFHKAARICAINEDKSEFRWLTTEGFGNWLPEINDKGQIVYMCHDGSDSEICLVNFDGTGHRQITHNETIDSVPYINNQGQIVFSCHDGNDFEICFAKANSPEIEILTDNEWDDMLPEINDNRLIAYICEQPGDAIEKSEATRQICTMNSEGKDKRQLTNDNSIKSQVSIQ